MPLLLCPNCAEGMREVERHGVRIDVCPKCRGVWLDRGELEKLLEAAAAGAGGDAPGPGPAASAPPSGTSPAYPYHPKKKKSFLREIFDFDIFD
ncbi:hypothetical protein HRbin39_00157 [bacterium HR39]|nr:hypothetical protein HRbin39_00157 [bacterium HR39]